MRYSDNDIQLLRGRVSERLSQKRLHHVLGVERAAEKLGVMCGIENINSLRAAALLHDIAKEYTINDICSFISSDGIFISADDMMSPEILHAYAAPYIIKRDFHEFAVSEILSACFNHTVGDPDMDVFDEIIFISDYIEDGRIYDSCIKVREDLYSSLQFGNTSCNIQMLHRAVVLSINFTEASLIKSNKHINQKMLLTKNAFLIKN